MKLFLMVDNECKDPMRVRLPGRSKGTAFEGLSSVCQQKAERLSTRITITAIQKNGRNK